MLFLLRRLVILAGLFGLWLPHVCFSADDADEIQSRLQWWQTHHPEYVPQAENPQPYLSESVTAVYAFDRTGAGADAMARDFLSRGYFLLDALTYQSDMAPLSPSEIATFIDALRLTHVQFVDTKLFDNDGKRVVAVAGTDPDDPSHKQIQVYRKDWMESQRLHVDLVRLVFHEYLRVIGKGDDNYVVSRGLTVTERDFGKRAIESPECVSGHRRPLNIDLNIAQNFPYLGSPAYLNGSDFDPMNQNSFRVFHSRPACTDRASSYVVSIGNFTKTLYLHGGDGITVFVPSGREIYNALRNRADF